MLHPALRCVFAASLIGLTCAGCGKSEYERRLGETAALYSYLQGFEEHLNPRPWQRTDLGIAMRVPKPFQAPRPRAGTKGQNGEVLPSQLPADPLGVELPGLLDSWGTVLGNSGQPNAFLYVLSNHERLQDNGVGKESESFLTDVETAISDVFRITIPSEEANRAGDNTRSRLLVPPRNSANSKYADSKDYTLLLYAGPGSRAAEADVYMTKKGNVHVAVVVVLTERSTPQMRQRMELALQTLQIEDLRPQRGGSGGRGPAARGAGTGGF